MNEGLGPVGQSLTVQPREGFPNGPRGDLVHREAQSRHVQRGADAALLAEDRLAGSANELPHCLEVLLAAERGARLALLRQDLVQHVLGGDRGMVQARQEERRTALHPRVAGHQVFDGGALSVAQMQRAGHVGRRLDDDERRLAPIGPRALAVRVEDVRSQPPLEDGVLYLTGPVGLGQLRSGGSRRALCSRSRLCRLRFLGHGSLSKQTTRSPSGRTGRGTTCWFGVARRPVIEPPIRGGFGVRFPDAPALAACGRRGHRPPGALSGASRTARELRSRRACGGAFSLARALHGAGPALCTNRREGRSVIVGWRRYSSRSTP